MAEIKAASFARLNSTNYGSWEVQMEAALQWQKLWDVVGGDDRLRPQVSLHVCIREHGAHPLQERSV